MAGSVEGQKPRFASTWILVAGCVFGAATLLYFMFLVVVAVQGQEVPKDSRFLVVVIIALGAALASAFLGGHAAVNGKIPFSIWPINEGAVMKFSTTGGVAIFIIVMLLGYMFYVKPAASEEVKGEGYGRPRSETKIYEQKCIEARSAADTVALRELGKNARVKIDSIKKVRNGELSSDKITELVNVIISKSTITGEFPGRNCDTFTVIRSAPLEEIKSYQEHKNIR